MMRAWVFSGTKAIELPDLSMISEHIGHGNELVWLDIERPTTDEYDALGQEFDLHELAVDDARERGQRPRIEQYPSHAFLVVYDGHHPDEMAEVDIFIGPNWLISVREPSDKGKVCDLDAVHTRFARTRGRGVSPGMLLYELLDHIVDGYFEACDAIEDEIELAEQSIWQQEGTDGEPVQRRLLRLRAQLVKLRRSIVPLRDVVLTILRDEIPWVHAKDRVYFQNVLDHLLRVIDQIDTARELLGNASDAHLATISNNMNVVMKRMTSWGAILLGASLVAGIYGMNFRAMPGLEADQGFAAAIGTMLLFTVVLATWFKKKDWL